MKNEKVKYVLFSKLYSFEKEYYYWNIYNFLKKLQIEYPHFRKWYNNLFTNMYELKKEREIIICQAEEDIAAIAILKKTDEENKICTFRVEKRYQKIGIGKRLMELCFEWLEDEKPLITMRKSRQQEFKKLMEYYNFSLEQKMWGYYNLFSTEIVYNGELPKKKIFLNKLEVIELEREAKRCFENGRFDWERIIENWLDNLARIEIQKRIILES